MKNVLIFLLGTAKNTDNFAYLRRLIYVYADRKTGVVFTLTELDCFLELVVLDAW